jgi:tetratricopeptide (TPR) repeat protein
MNRWISRWPLFAGVTGLCLVTGTLAFARGGLPAGKNGGFSGGGQPPAGPVVQPLPIPPTTNRPVGPSRPRPEYALPPQVTQPIIPPGAVTLPGRVPVTPQPLPELPSTRPVPPMGRPLPSRPGLRPTPLPELPPRPQPLPQPLPPLQRPPTIYYPPVTQPRPPFITPPVVNLPGDLLPGTGWNGNGGGWTGGGGWNRPGWSNGNVRPPIGRPWEVQVPNRDEWVGIRARWLDQQYNTWSSAMGSSSLTQWHDYWYANWDGHWGHLYPHYVHWRWYHGYAPCWRAARWDYLWRAYPPAAGFGVTMWGLNSVSWSFGLAGGYVNPYCDGPVVVQGRVVANYVQPFVASLDQTSLDAITASGNDPQRAAQLMPPFAAERPFEVARSAYYGRDFVAALQYADQALVIAPRDTVVHEFRALCLFALGRYREAAATMHSLLATGPGWDWTTLSSLYSSPDLYSAQLRELELAARRPNSPDLNFLLAYHYLTVDQSDAALRALQKVVRVERRDIIATQLLEMFDPPPGLDRLARPAGSWQPAIPAVYLPGTWSAQVGSASYTLTLTQANEFLWTLRAPGRSEDIRGVYIVNGNTLVFEPDTGGLLLADLVQPDERTLLATFPGLGAQLDFRR